MTFLFLNLLFLDAAGDKFLFVSDRIFTVMSVVLFIWISVVIHLILIDRKITRLEKERKKQ